jgi:endonuclease III
MAARPLTLPAAVRTLEAHYGEPEPPPTADPFELVLWENVAYLALPARRREAFALLARTIGTTPPAILAAERSALERVTGHGILKRAFAAKLVECARIAFEQFGGDVNPTIRQPLDAAKRALRRFPGIGEPGAEKILLFTGRQALLAPDSNGLRVLVRLGFVREEKSYARTYAASRAVAQELGWRPQALQKAHLLLQLHGQTLCKRRAPRCNECPLMPGCAYAGAVRVAAAKHPRSTSRRSSIAPRARPSSGSRTRRSRGSR